MTTGIAQKMNWTTSFTTQKLALAAYLHDMTLTDNQLSRVHNLDELS